MATITTIQIPFSSPDIIRPGAGAEQWHNGTARIPNPTEISIIENSLDVYYRFEWNRLEGSTQGSYTWTYLDNLIKDAINKGQKLSFGIMTFRSDAGSADATYGNAKSSYPLYLHSLMQSEASKDWVGPTGKWVPNWNSSHYISRLRALHQAIRDHLVNTRHTPTVGPNAGKSVLFADAIYCIDVRGFGNWGEWHLGSISTWDAYPAGLKPTETALKAIIDAHTQIFDKWPLVMMVAAFDGGYTGINIFARIPAVAYHALTVRNAWGAVGFRRDQWGDTATYLPKLMEENNGTYNGVVFKNLILNKYKEAPVTGEPNPMSSDMSDLQRQILTHHATSFGNGNFGAYPATLVIRDRIRAAFKLAGYRLTIEGGSYSNTSNFLTLSLNWRNTGIAPTYEPWDVNIFLKSSTGNLIQVGKSVFKPKLFQPSSVVTTVTDIIPLTIATGTYTLAIKISEVYRNYMPIFIEGRKSDGTYELGPVVIPTVQTTTTTTTTTTSTTSTTTKIPVTTTTTTTIIPQKTIKSITLNVLYTDGSTASQIIQ